MITKNVIIMIEKSVCRFYWKYMSLYGNTLIAAMLYRKWKSEIVYFFSDHFTSWMLHHGP